MTPTSPSPLHPSLPSRALLIAPTVERAATLGVAFDDTRAATLDDFVSVLAAEGPTLPCVAVTGVPTRGGRLAAVVDQVLVNCTDIVQFVLDHSEPLGSELLLNGSEALRGLSLVDRIDLGGVPCLRFRPGRDRDIAPDLASLREELVGRPGAHVRLAMAVDSLVAPVQAERFQAQVAELEAQVASVTASLEATTAALAEVRRDHKATATALNRLRSHPLGRAAVLLERVVQKGANELRKSSRVRRLARKAAVVTVGVVLVGADAVVVGLITDSGSGGAVLTVLVLLSLAQLLYAWRSSRRVHALDGRVGQLAQTTAEERKAIAAARRQSAKVERALAELTATSSALERNLAIVTASSVDTAHAVAELLQRRFPPAAEGAAT